jgi:CheY-like chemotaxis protein/predicted transcriptional regulator
LTVIQEKALGSFSFDVAKRMLDVLSEHGIWMKKTNLASKTRLNYNVCLRYIQMLNNLGWIDVNPEVSITEQGKRVFAKLLDISEERASNIHDDSVWQSDLRKKKSLEDSCFSSLSITQMKPLAVTGEKQIGLRVKQKTSNSKKKTIMIVDDDEDIAQTYKYFLSSFGYEVRTFIDSRSALCEYLFDCFLYDLLILDIRMKDINGLQLYQSIKAINPECRAIFVSALDAAREVASVLPGMRPQDIIRKPVSREQLVTAVKTALVQS